MKTFILTTLALVFSLGLKAQTAEVQIIHNSADAAASTVDIYLDGTLIEDDFPFRQATAFLTVPAESEIVVGIAPSTSTSVNDTIAAFAYTLAASEKYIIVANGIVSGSGYSPAPGFDLYVYPMARDAAASSGNTDVLVFHGSTDAPTVDIYETAVVGGELINDLMYGDFFGYAELATNDYILEVRLDNGVDIVADYAAPLSTLGLDDAAITVLASGFLNPANNSDGAAFGLYAALASGGPLVELPEVKDAQVQIIHNSADAAAATVDVYLNGTLIGDDFAFRTATEFLTVPAEQDIVVGIAPSTSTSVDDTIVSFTYNLADKGMYTIVANGIISGSGYTPAETFDLYVYDMARDAAASDGNTDVLVFHGSTDAPTVDIYETAVVEGELINDLMYGDFFGYAELPTNDYVLEVRDETGMNTVAAYQAPLSTLGLDDAAITVVASGFLNPANNSDGEAFGLWVALTSGGALVELPVVEDAEAMVQIIHNSPDAAAEMVDVYLDGSLIKDDFMFRTATEFLTVPAEQDIVVGIAPSTSTSVDDTIALFTYNLMDDNNYILIANGMLDLGTEYSIGNSGLTFTPENLVVTAGDEVTFTVGSMHPVVEVSAETWMMNGSTPLDGGFSAPNGTETVIFNEAGTYYYICENHIGQGMKGKITVVENTFGIDVFDMGRMEASTSGNTDVLVNHGSVDAPTVDVWETAVVGGELINNLMYGDFFGYAELATNDYVLEIRDETGMNTVAAYQAPLSTLGLDNAAITVVASGFLAPENFNSENAFGLYVALASGGALVELPIVEEPAEAMVQIIHNSADAAAEMVDVYLDGALIGDDFAFRTATEFLSVPAEQDIVVGIAPSTSTSVDDTIASFTYNLMDDGKYIIVANGIVSGSGYDPAQPFNLYVYDMARDMATNSGNTDVLVFHGSTDAPTVDIYETAVVGGELINDLMYGDFFGYAELATNDYVLEVRDETGMNTVAAYQAPLSTLGLDDAAITVVASGFLNPANNSDGEAFGLWVALASGGALVELPTVEEPAEAMVQIIHNSADTAAAMVDVYLNGALIGDDFAFRTSTPFLTVPAEQDIVVGIAPSTSTSVDDTIASFTYNLMADEKYIIVANGIVSASGYDPAQAFDLYVFPMARNMAATSGNTDVLVFHGSTDAPTVDIYETAVVDGELINDLMYGDFFGYAELATNDYILEVRDETGMNTVAAYQAPLSTLGLDDAAITVVASGFLNPANNSNGAPFGLWVSLAAGGDMVELPAAVGLFDNANADFDVAVYPVPATTQVTVKAEKTIENASIINAQGQVINTISGNGTNQIVLDINTLVSGTYFIRLQSTSNVSVERFIKQ